MRNGEFTIPAARLRLMSRKSCGLLAEIGYGMCHVPDTSIGSLYTDGKTVHYNPIFLESLSDSYKESALAHEYAHAALLHPVRYMAGMDKDVANIAMDHAVNLMLIDAGLSMPPGWHADKQYKGMSWEHIYTHLMQDKDQDKDQDQDKDKDKGEGEGEGEAKPGKFGDVQGDVRPATGKNGKPAIEQELSEISVEMADRVMRIAQAQKMAGTGSGMSERIVAEMITPAVPDLYQAIAALLERSNDDRSYSRINRRLIHAGYFPGIESKQCPPIVIAIDTSGSINYMILSAFNSILRRVVADFRPRSICVIYCDYEINTAPVEFGPDDVYDIVPHGGGGTDFAPPFAWIDTQMFEKPAALIYFTDLDGQFPDVAPDYPVLWAAIPSSYEKPVPFGDVCQIQL